MELEVIIDLPCMSVEKQITFLFLQKYQPGAQRGAHSALSERRVRANKGPPAKMVETQEDFHHRFLALEGL